MIRAQWPEALLHLVSDASALGLLRPPTTPCLLRSGSVARYQMQDSGGAPTVITLQNGRDYVTNNRTW